MVIVDTAIWIDYLRNKRSPHAGEMIELIDGGRAALIGVVSAELLRGMHSQEQRDRLQRELGGATFLEMTQTAWRLAGVISSELDSRGQPIPMSDVFIASLTLDGDHELFTLDQHFERIPGLRLYKREGDLDA